MTKWRRVLLVLDCIVLPLALVTLAGMAVASRKDYDAIQFLWLSYLVMVVERWRWQKQLERQ